MRWHRTRMKSSQTLHGGRFKTLSSGREFSGFTIDSGARIARRAPSNIKNSMRRRRRRFVSINVRWSALCRRVVGSAVISSGHCAVFEGYRHRARYRVILREYIIILLSSSSLHSAVSLLSPFIHHGRTVVVVVGG